MHGTQQLYCKCIHPVHLGTGEKNTALFVSQRPDPTTIVAAASAAAAGATKRDAPGEWDIANMAPKQKKGFAGEEKAPVGVISAAAKRNRQEEGFVVTAAQVALMGGQWKPSADEECAHTLPSHPYL